MEHQHLRTRVWNALHTYYWDAAKLRAWYTRLCDNTGDVSDIVSGIEAYPNFQYAPNIPPQ